MADFNVLKPNLETYSGNRTATSEYSGEEGLVRNGQPIQQVDSKAELNTSSDIRNRSEVSNEEDIESLTETLSNLNSQLEKVRNYLRFEKDEDSERMVIFIRNSETGEVIRQIPSQEFLDISNNISKYLEMRQELSEKMALPPGLITDIQA